MEHITLQHNQLDKAIDTYNSYDKILLIGDFNAEINESYLESFLYEHDLENLVKENTCFMSVENPSCIDLMLTNSNMSFQNTTTVFSGLSDFHKLVLTVLKINFTKNIPKEIIYRDYKNFDSFLFNDELQYVLDKDKIKSCIMFEELFLKVLDKHAPVKKKVVRANHAKYISKPLRKAIMKRSYLEKVYLKKKTPLSLEKYKKHKNYCSRIYKKEKRNFFNTLNTSFINDNKLFWKTVKPFFSNKGSFGNKIKLVENEELLQDDNKIAEEMNNFFKNAVSELDMKENSYIINQNVSYITDPIEKAIEKYKFHPSILLIKEKTKCSNASFDFSPVTVNDVEKEIKKLNPNKATTFNTIPSKMLLKTSEISAKILHKLFNETVETGDYPENLKLADITPVFKKKDPLNKMNYRPVSVLPSVSKLFEKLMQNQLVKYIENHLSPHLCGYRKGFSSQQALISLIENWKKSLDKKGYGGAVLIDLSKAFDTIKHDLLVAKLHAYGFSKKALTLILNY